MTQQTPGNRQEAAKDKVELECNCEGIDFVEGLILLLIGLYFTGYITF